MHPVFQISQSGRVGVMESTSITCYIYITAYPVSISNNFMPCCSSMMLFCMTHWERNQRLSQWICISTSSWVISTCKRSWSTEQWCQSYPAISHSVSVSVFIAPILIRLFHQTPPPKKKPLTHFHSLCSCSVNIKWAPSFLHPSSNDFS